MEFSQAELLVLGRLTDDPELLAVLLRIDAAREAMLLDQMRQESQTLEPNTNLIIQHGARAAERAYGARAYVEQAKSAAKRIAAENAT